MLLISCKKCGVQYVGETSQTLRCRFNNHRNRLKQLCGLYLYHHFSSDGHTLDDISIMPIEEVVSEPDDGITLGCKRLQREEFWYRELCTIYPYGLNDNVKGVGNVSKSDGELIVYALFNKSERKFRKRKPHRRRRRVTSNEVSEQIKSVVFGYKSTGFTFRLRSYLMGLAKYKMKIAADVISTLVIDEHIPTRVMLLVNDLMAYRFKITVTPRLKNVEREDTNKCFMNVMFHNKGMDMIDLPRILNSKRVMATVPSYLKGPPPVVSYTYTRTIAGKIFNNRKVVEDLDMDAGTAGMDCSCSSSNYKYEPCGHVVTGDLSIIKDVKLRNLIKKGPTYREQNNIDWRVNVKNCKEAVTKYFRKWVKTMDVDARVLRDWEQTVHECIDEKVRSLKQKHVNKRKKHVLKSILHLNSLSNLHENYVLVPADKAANNVIVVCKKYYLDVIVNELKSTSTYREVNDECENVVSRHLHYMMKNSIDVDSEHECLPSFYWLPKLHKIPYGTRFIAASNKCTSKRLSSLLTSCFKTILIHYKQYCEGIYRHTGVNCYWVIDNSKEVLDRLHNINKVSGAKCFDSFDFATLYTNIPHDGLKSNIRNLVREAYKVRGAKYLIVDRHGKAHWSQSPSSVTTCMSIDKSKLVELTEYLIDNVYVKAGNRVYRQTIGIPMGTDCAPQLANLYLFHHEYMYMRALMKSNLGMAKRFCNTVRYIDDLLALNNKKFEEEIVNIYPPELTLKRTTESDTTLSYLDVSISICQGKFITEVFDKRDNFNFNIVNYPYMCSNIPAKPTYGVYISQLIRISRICDKFDSFVKRHRLLTDRLIKQGFWYSKLCSSFIKFARRHIAEICKYRVSIRTHVVEGICMPLDVRHDLVRNVTTRGLGRGNTCT